METEILSKIDSINQLHKKSKLELTLNPIKSLEEQPVKIYQVVNDMFTTKIIEHKVLNVTDGRTKYDPSKNHLFQGLRFTLAKGVKVDLFNNEAVEYCSYERNGRTYDLINYYFVNKQHAEKKALDENYRLLIKSIINS